MDEPNLISNIPKLSWNIATNPELYWELSPNPYTPRTIQLISERFCDVNTADVIRAVVFAEPEGKYDRDFLKLSKDRQEEELLRQEAITSEGNKRLLAYFKKHIKDFRLQQKEIVYGNLSKFVFGTDNIKEIENIFSQNQRLSFRLTIVNLIEDSLVPVQYSRESSRVWNDLTLNLALATLSLLLIFFISQPKSAPVGVKNTETNTQVLAANVQNTAQGFPVRLEIPSINVDAAIEYVGVTPAGIMGVPVNTSDVAWFDVGPKPGERGSAVIAGHFDGVYGQTAVFSNLNKLKVGDHLYVEDDNGVTTAFVVQTSNTYDPGYADDVFSRNDGTYLNLITCDGVWDGTKKSYDKRLVVFTKSVFKN